MKRLTEHHPLTKKMQKLDAFMDEIGINIEYNGYRTVVKDTETGTEAYLKDNESGASCYEIPHFFEWKLIIED